MPRARLNPEAVTEAAATIVDRDGRAALTLACLASELGVAAPSRYKHIGGLQDLNDRVAALAIRRLTDALVAAALGRSGRQALRAIARAHRGFATEHRRLYPLTQSAFGPSSVAQREAERAVEVLAAVVRGYGLRDESVTHGIRLVRSGLHGFSDIEAHGGFALPSSMDESFDILVEALDTSLCHLSTAKTSS